MPERERGGVVVWCERSELVWVSVASRFALAERSEVRGRDLSVAMIVRAEGAKNFFGFSCICNDSPHPVRGEGWRCVGFIGCFGVLLRRPGLLSLERQWLRHP